MTDRGYDEWLTALGEGEGFYLACPEGHGSLPPRRACPRCGATTLTAEPLPASGVVETFTEVHVAAPDFASQTPYVTAIASFGPVRLTGVLRGVPNGDGVETGLPVVADAAENPDTGDGMVVFRPE